MNQGKTLLDADRFALTIERLCQHLVEDYDDFDDTFLVGIQPRGPVLATRIANRLSQILGKKLEIGRLDITFYRDDFRRGDKPLYPHENFMPFNLAEKKVILLDDVLFTGRTIQAALMALQHYGRPAKVDLLTLVDRRFNRHLPVAADYIGISVDVLDEEYVKVNWNEIHGRDEILLFEKKPH
jgi:pyrimidine operon attenuation protein / uracil phosphoribosyltransferase